YAAKKCADSILSVNPHALIFIEGVEQYPKTDQGFTYDTPDIWDAPADKSPWYGAWWGGNLRGVKDFPVVPESGTSQIVYSPHDYGPSVYAQTWFDKDFSEQTLLDDYWYDTWAYINDQDIAPLLIGEWGGHMDEGKNQKWMELLRDYMIKNHINHTFWCINPNSGDTGGLLDPTFQNWDADKYALFEESLWQTSSSGKYIGLDHQVALGANGLSLNDYYGSYAASEGSNINGGTKGAGQTIPVETTAPKSTTTTTQTTTTTTQPTTTTTTQPTTTLTTTTTTTQTIGTLPNSGDVVKYGDANTDGKVSVADAVAILQYIANKDKFALKGQGLANADCYNPGDGITAKDALAIQKYDAHAITELPEIV
ncbi:MAG: cellulase family glycosylhydrolase, partial [Ruminococcus sp.]|nr:cellulase family glycosylhydrolase [Ruminococcus sp.]